MGGVNTLVGYILYAFFIFLGIRYFLATFFATFFGVIFNFFTTRRIFVEEFNNKNLFKFFIVYFFMYLISLIFIKLLNIFKVNSYISGIIIIFLSIPTFILNKYFVFKNNYKEAHYSNAEEFYAKSIIKRD